MHIKIKQKFGFLPIAFLMVLTILSCEQKNQKQPTSGTVIKVLDGDTYDLLLPDKTTQRIRMEGIDAPEKGMPFYKVSKKYLKDLCIQKQVRIKKTGTDRYGRKLAYTYLEDGRELGEEMLQAGLAWHYKKYNKEARLAELEKVAQQLKIHIWSDPKPMPPWVNKQLHREGISTKDSFEVGVGRE